MVPAARGLAGALIALSVAAVDARAEDLHVPGAFERIGDAVRAAVPGDRIVVASGSYEERVVCRKRDLTFEAAGAVWTTGSKGTAALTIRARGVRVVGFHFQDAALNARGTGIEVRDNVFSGDASRALLQIRGKNAVVEGNQLVGVRLWHPKGTPLQVTGRNASVWHNRLAGVDANAGAIRVRGADVVVDGNEIDGFRGDAAVDVRGHRALVKDNLVDPGAVGVLARGRDVEVRGNRIDAESGAADGVIVAGNRAVVLGNTLGAGTGAGIRVDGHAAVVTENTLVDRQGEGITIVGRHVDVSRNSLRMMPPGLDLEGRPGEREDGVVSVVTRNDGTISSIPMVAAACPGIVVRSDRPGGVVRDNTILHAIGTGMDLGMDGAVVSGNDIDGRREAVTSLLVQGNDNQIVGNDTCGSNGLSIEIAGHRNRVTDNHMTDHDAEWKEFRIGVSALGHRNVIESNRISGLLAGAVDVRGNENHVLDNEVRDPERRRSFGAIDVFGQRNVIDRNRVDASGTDDFARRSAIDANGDQNRVSRNHVVGLVSTGIEVSGYSCEVVGNIVEGCAKSGLQLNAIDATVEGNQMSDCDNGAYLRVNDSIVRANTARNCTRYGIYLRGDVNVASENAAEACKDSGFYVRGDLNAMTRNEARSCGHGFRVSGARNDFDGSLAVACSADGFLVEGDANSLQDVTATSSGSDGIEIALGDGNRLQGCRGTTSAECGLRNAGTRTEVRDCTFDPNDRAGVESTESFAVFEGNVVSDPLSAPNSLSAFFLE